MKIEYLGHSCFLFTYGNTRIVTDPFSGIGYEMPPVAAEYVTKSHDHFDHNYVKGVEGVKEVFDKPGKYTAGGVKIEGVLCSHDDEGGKKRGKNVAFTFDFGGFTVCHLGDLGEGFSKERAAAFGQPDVLLIPVGGTYTVDAATAARYVCAIRPKLVIPMHYRTQDCALDIAPLSAFEKEWEGGLSGPVPSFDSADADALAGKVLVLERKHG